MTDTAPIVLRDVAVKFGERVVLDGMNLSVPRGKTLVLMGLSGSGKSVTLRTIAGLLRPDRGEAIVLGERVDSEDRASLRRARTHMGYVFQHAALLRWLTAIDNVALPLLESGVPEDEARERARKRLDELGLAESLDRYPDQISGGMAKRVGFARATVTDPKVILYDEPTTGLDPITTRTVDELIVRGRDDYGATSVVVSHDVESARRVGDLLGLLYEGRLAVVAPPDEFMKSEHPIVRAFVHGGRDR